MVILEITNQEFNEGEPGVLGVFIDTEAKRVVDVIAARTVRTLNDTISNFDENPQRLIFGGETVKDYDGRTRR